MICPDLFPHVVSLHPWVPYFIAHEIRTVHAWAIPDADVPDTDLLEAMAKLVNACLADGPTLVHCQTGLNRSALVAGLALTRDGMPAVEPGPEFS